MNTLKFKLFVIGGVALLVALLLVVVNIYSVNQGTQALATVYENQVKPAASLQSIDNLLKDVRFRMAAVLVDQMPVASSKKQVEEARQKVSEQWQQFKEKTKGNVFSAEAQKQIEKIDKQLLLLPEFLNKLSSAYADNDKNKIGSVLEDDWPLIQSGLLNPISTLVEFQQKSVNDTYQIGSAKGAQLIYVAIGSLLVSVIVLVLLGLSLFSAISTPLHSAISIARTIASGDLTQNIESHSTEEFNELLSALKAMNSRLVDIVDEVRTGSTTIATASKEIATGNMDLSSRTEHQASSLEQTSASMEELTSAVKKNDENARMANQLTASASDVAIKGGEVVMQVVGTMSGITAASKKIEDIISVIDGIAFQTNILALNAAVEAARAGEQGRGFAVVAAEVRQLAQRSATAAKEIKALIIDSGEKVVVGSKLVDEASSTMREVVASVERVTVIIHQIASASIEQTSGIEQINKAIEGMDEVTQQNAALVEQAAAATGSLQTLAENLVESINVFKTSHNAYAATSHELSTMRKLG